MRDDEDENQRKYSGEQVAELAQGFLDKFKTDLLVSGRTEPGSKIEMDLKQFKEYVSKHKTSY